MLMDNYNNKQIDILLSTYNGSKYLSELIESIINQTCNNWKLIIRDDGSEDSTVDVIKSFVIRFPDKIIYVKDKYNNLGPSQSFSKLMEYSNADYIMFCDQDDVWLNNKIELTIKKMLLLEVEFIHKPILIHTDLTIVNEELKVISNSFWNYQKLNPKYKKLNNILIQNIVTGCSMMINKKLKELAHPIPNEAIMHDWWIALVASIYSGIYEINSPLVLYRQHSKNNIGAKKYSLYNFITRFGKLNESHKSNINIIKQSNPLLLRYTDNLTIQQYNVINNFSNLLIKNRLNRLIDIIRFKYRKQGKIRNIGFFITMLLLNKKKLTKY